MYGIDPLSPAIVAWIAAKPEEEELVIRLAFSALFECCRNYRPWKDRIEELKNELVTDDEAEDRLAWRAENLFDSLHEWLDDHGMKHCQYVH
jgi:hypothetical protein